jgi:hypothetical protein
MLVCSGAAKSSFLKPHGDHFHDRVARFPLDRAVRDSSLGFLENAFFHRGVIFGSSLQTKRGHRAEVRIFIEHLEKDLRIVFAVQPKEQLNLQQEKYAACLHGGASRLLAMPPTTNLSEERR